MTTLRTAVIRLRRTTNEIVKEDAREAGLSKEAYVSSLLEKYAAEEPKITAHSGGYRSLDLVEVRAAVDAKTWERARRRARLEGKRGLSNAVEDLVAGDE